MFTVLNIFFGFMCIVQAMQGEYLLAAWYIVLGAICDTLDGFMARLTNSASEFGVELDSLADVVSFGVAPSFLLYALFLNEYGPFGMLVASAPLIMGALRLARFNVQLVGYNKDSFTGMPIPLSALTLVSFLFFFTPQAVATNPLLQKIYIALTLICGVLMISTIRYPVFPKFSPKQFKSQPWQMSMYVAAGIVVAVSLGRLLFPVLLLIILSGPFFAAGRKIKGSVNRIRDDGIDDTDGSIDDTDGSIDDTDDSVDGADDSVDSTVIDQNETEIH